MEKLRNSSKSCIKQEEAPPWGISRDDTLLPPTRRYANSNTPTPTSSLDKKKIKKWSIDGLFKRVSSIIENSASASTLSSSSFEELQTVNNSQKKEFTGNKISSLQDLSDLLNMNNNQLTLPNATSGGGSNSRSSDGSFDSRNNSRQRCKDKVKARVEAKRDRLCVGDSSMDESSNNDDNFNKSYNNAHKRRSRASRTERYLKRMCNGSSVSKINGQNSDDDIVKDNRVNIVIGNGDEFRPIERMPKSPIQNFDASSNGVIQPITPHFENNPIYKYPATIGVNPLVQQTLQYFSEFDKGNKPIPKPRKLHNKKSPSPPPPQIPPKPPSRDIGTRVLVNGLPIDSYQQIFLSTHHDHHQQYYDKENGYRVLEDRMMWSPNTEVRNINEGRVMFSSEGYGRTCAVVRRSPLRESVNLTPTSTSTIYYTPPPPLPEKPKFNRSPSKFSPIPPQSSPEGSKKSYQHRPRSRQNTQKLEEALCELEAIYKSLELGDEELLERADQRTMEEMHYKGLTSSPIPYDAEEYSIRRKTWADSNLLSRDEPDSRLKDDMAYRRMHHSKGRPASSADGQLSSISYLITSPVPFGNETRFRVDPKRKVRNRKEPDVTLDDVVFRSRHYANNILKVADPQPPFGIPLGPITTAPDSDYLHSNPSCSPQLRSPYVPNRDPDLVTDDLAFRALRKDATGANSSSRQSSPSFYSPAPTPSPLPYNNWRKKRSFSSNFYGIINPSPRRKLCDDYDEDVFMRRASDIAVINGQRRNEAKTFSSDLEFSGRSCEEEDSDNRLEPVVKTHVIVVESRDETDAKSNSDKGSVYQSSSASISPPPLPALPPPESEQKINSSINDKDATVYKQLCKDLENLVELTKGIDKIPNADSSNPTKTEEQEKVSKVEQTKPSAREIVDSIKSDDDKSNVDEPSPIKRELSNILENLKTLREECEVKINVDKAESKKDDDKSTKEKFESIKEDELHESNVPTVKLSSENNKVVKSRKRSSLRSKDENSSTAVSTSWEGERCNLRSILSQRNRQQSVSMFCSAAASAHEVTRLTAKCIYHITNYLTVQCCILLVFFIVLLLAIVNVP